MSEVDKHIFRVCIVDEEGSKRVVANAFRVRGKNSPALVTAAHVAFEDRGAPRCLTAESVGGGEIIVNPVFKRRGWQDIAEATLAGDSSAGLELGSDMDITGVGRLKIRSPKYDQIGEKPVKKTTIGGIPVEKRSGRGLDRKYDLTFRVVGENEDQIGWPGCSGSPILNEKNQVVGILCRGGWEKGVNFVEARIYTSRDNR